MTQFFRELLLLFYDANWCSVEFDGVLSDQGVKARKYGLEVFVGLSRPGLHEDRPSRLWVTVKSEKHTVDEQWEVDPSDMAVDLEKVKVLIAPVM
jgi:hypothetical protein